MKNKKIKVLIIDDHSIVRTGIKASLSKNPALTIVGEANDGQESLPMIKALKPDVVITDITMPHVSGLELLGQIKNENAAIKLIVFTMHEETEYLHASIERGADGFLLKTSDLAELSKAIESVYAGKCFYSEQLSNSITTVIRNKNSRTSQDVQLSPRELDVLNLIVAGQSNKMISSELCISDKTVAIHRSNIMRKVNAKNSADLVRKAIENNILKPKLALI